MIHLTSYSRRAEWGGPGRTVAAMALLPTWIRTRVDDQMPALAPDADDLRDMRAALKRRESGAIGDYELDCCMAWYRRRYESRLARLPEHGSQAQRAGHAIDGLRDDDTLVCTCAAPWKPDGSRNERRNPCHLELLAPVLFDWGYGVRLYGRALDGEWRPEDVGWPDAGLRPREEV